MADFLTTRTEFYCTASPPPINAASFTVSTSGKVTHKGDKILTTATKISGSGGICQPLTAMAQGTPQSCKFQKKMTAWLPPNFDLKCTAEGKNLLTSDSCCSCPFGGIIKVWSADAQGFKQGKANAPTVSPVTDNPQRTTSAEKIFAPKISATTVAPKIFSPLNFSATSNASKNFSEPKISIATGEAAENFTHGLQEIGAASEKIAAPIETDLRCKICRRTNCKYRLDEFKAPAVFDNNSAILKSNYEKFLAAGKNFTAADENYLRSLETGGAWSYAAHHIISGNQVFAKVPAVMKIATACGYDINCSENCIMLPSKLEGHGNLSQIGKSASAFDVMSATGMQWHLGGHSYSFAAEEHAQILRQIERRTGRSAKIKSYAELLIEDLRKIRHASDDVCPAQIITALNNLSAKVRAKLAAFSENPAASFPYYVSREAYLFAFKVPRLRKFITVTAENDAVKLNLYKTGDAGNDFKFRDSLKTDDAVEIVKFSGNVHHFIFLRGTDPKNFSFVPEFQMSADELRAAEIIVWLRENPVENYVSPARKISERLSRMEGNA